MNNPIKVKTFTTSEAIIDPLYRAVIGLDTNDLKLFESAFINKKDAVFEMDGYAMEGLDVIHDNVFKGIGPLDTTHFITNTRVQVEDGADTAVLTAYALAQHYRSGEGADPATKRLLSGSMYHVDVVKDNADDLWKIKKWAMKIVWLEGDKSIVAPS